jgi:hypothetical protein
VRNFGLILRRAPWDRRALRFVLIWLAASCWLLYEAGLMVYLGFWGTLCSLCVLLLGFGVAVLIGKSNARATDSLLKLSAKPAPADEDYRGHRTKLARELLKTAILVDRAGFEALHREGKILPAHLGICRRRTLDLAQRTGLWEDFTGSEQALLLSQEGSWEWKDTWPLVLRVEDVRVLRWVVGIDSVLVPFEFLKPDLTPALELTVKPALLTGNRCMAPYDLRPAQTMAQAMVARCLADGAERGWLEVKDAGEREQLLNLAEKMSWDESSDLLIGTTTVGKAGLEQVRWVTQAALRRLWVLTGVIGYLNGPPEGELTLEPQKKKEPVCP